jgi:hypothetical protein
VCSYPRLCYTCCYSQTEHKAFFAVAAALAPVTPCAPVPASNAVTGAVTGPQQPPAYTAKQIALLRKLSSALNIAPQLTSVLFASESNSNSEATDTSATVKIETVEPETAASAVTESNGTDYASTEAAATEAAAAGSSSGSSSSSSGDASNKRKADEISTSTDSNSSDISSKSNSSRAILSNGDLTQVAKLLRKQLPSISLSD